jgi:hypothetical protein
VTKAFQIITWKLMILPIQVMKILQFKIQNKIQKILMILKKIINHRIKIMIIKIIVIIKDKKILNRIKMVLFL